MDIELLEQIGENREKKRQIASVYDAINNSIKKGGSFYFYCKDVYGRTVKLQPIDTEYMAFFSLMLRRLEHEMDQLDNDYGKLEQEEGDVV